MTPPELLHASGSGVCKYIFESLGAQIGGVIARDDIDKMHIKTGQADEGRNLISVPKCQANVTPNFVFYMKFSYWDGSPDNIVGWSYGGC
jgi:hypothetical protein